MDQTIVLSDEMPCVVRVLGLFELDVVALDGVPGPFYEEIEGTKGGRIMRRPYKPPNAPPAEPNVPRSQVKEGTLEYEAWLDYDLYQEFLEYRREENRVMGKYQEDVKAYILSSCLAKEDVSRIVATEDWLKIHSAALSVQLVEEDLADALRNNFQSEVPRPGPVGDTEG